MLKDKTGEAFEEQVADLFCELSGFADLRHLTMV
jgi:hypothetical protein